MSSAAREMFIREVVLLRDEVRDFEQYPFCIPAVRQLDEPEAALSPQRQLGLLKLIDELAHEKKSQFIIATHSPIVLAYPDAVIYSLDGANGPEVVAYEETEHFALTRDFLLDRRKFLSRLFAPA